MKIFEYPQMIILTRSNREASYDPENPYHCTFKSCCYEGKECSNPESTILHTQDGKT